MKTTYKILSAVLLVVALILLLSDFDEDNNILAYQISIIIVKIGGLITGYIAIWLWNKKE